MRLINADALIEHLSFEKKIITPANHEYLSMWIDVIQGVLEEILREPTIEAIPIAMIQREIENWDLKKPESCHAICYRHLIEDWRRENENKRSE